jgi:hypothetical protein
MEYNGKEQVEFLQTKTEVLSSKDFPVKKEIPDRFDNWLELLIVTIKELGK